MGAITIRNLPDDVIARIKTTAKNNSRSMEQELRQLIQERFMSKREAIARIRARWKDLPITTAKEVARWRDESRP